MNMNKEERKFDLVIIGTGTAASTTASECSSAGWSVAIIDSLPFGGTCALRGCDPKKVLVEAAKIIDSNQRHESKGIIGSQCGLLLIHSRNIERMLTLILALFLFMVMPGSLVQPLLKSRGMIVVIILFS